MISKLGINVKKNALVTKNSRIEKENKKVWRKISGTHPHLITS